MPASARSSRVRHVARDGTKVLPRSPGAIIDLDLRNFDPSQLYVSGRGGVYLNMNDIATLYQDSLGTLKVTAPGESVALVKDKSGNGHDVSAALATTQPTYQETTLGRGHILFDGTDDALAAAGVSIGSSDFMIAAAWQDQIGAVLGETPAIASVGSTLAGEWMYRNNEGKPSFTGDAASIAADHATVVDTTKAYVSSVVRSGASLKLRVNGKSSGEVEDATAGAALSAAKDLLIGSGEGAAANFWKGPLFGLVLVIGTVTAQERANTEHYLAKLAGISL